MATDMHRETAGWKSQAWIERDAQVMARDHSRHVVDAEQPSGRCVLIAAASQHLQFDLRVGSDGERDSLT